MKSTLLLRTILRKSKVDPYEPTAGESRVLEELQQGVYTLGIRGAEARCTATIQIQVTPKSSRTITTHLFSMTEARYQAEYLAILLLSEFKTEMAF